MSKYTTDIKSICESYLQNKGVDISSLSPDAIISQSINYVFDFTFPIYDADYLPVLEHNILRHYYMREIGSETVGRFKLFLNDRLNLIMPKYNILYKSELYNLDPLSNSSEIENYDRTANTTADNTTQGTSKSDIEGTSNANVTNTTGVDSQHIFSDTPQGLLSNKDYATSVDKDTSSGTNTTQDKTTNSTTQNNTINNQDKQNINNTENYVRKRSGLSGKTTSENIDLFINKFKSIDMMIIEELSDLFMLLW